jgi:hypothetical protein
MKTETHEVTDPTQLKAMIYDQIRVLSDLRRQCAEREQAIVGMEEALKKLEEPKMKVVKGGEQ